MLYRETIAVCSQIRTKHINTVCGQSVKNFTLKIVVYIVTMVFKALNTAHIELFVAVKVPGSRLGLGTPYTDSNRSSPQKFILYGTMVSGKKL